MWKNSFASLCHKWWLHCLLLFSTEMNSSWLEGAHFVAFDVIIPSPFWCIISKAGNCKSINRKSTDEKETHKLCSFLHCVFGNALALICLENVAEALFVQCWLGHQISLSNKRCFSRASRVPFFPLHYLSQCAISRDCADTLFCAYFRGQH